MNRCYQCYETDIGAVTIVCEAGAIIEVMRGEEAVEQAERTENVLLQKAVAELNEYLSGKRKHFTLPLAPKGTPFQKKVWEALQQIPYGETRSYRQIAKAAGSPKAYRAVGMANHHNPIMIFIPCHRVIGADGSLVGYGGGLDLKEKLLRLEEECR